MGKPFSTPDWKTRDFEPARTTDFQRGQTLPAQEDVRTRDRQHTPVPAPPNRPTGSKPTVSAAQLFLAGKLAKSERLRIRPQITVPANREPCPKQRVPACDLPVQLKHSAQQKHGQRGLAEGTTGVGLWEVGKAAEEENTKPTKNQR